MSEPKTSLEYANDSGDGRAPDLAWPEALELSVVVPTFNEIENIFELVARVERALSGIGWELIVVDDDSPDGTAEAIRALARRSPRIRCIRRVGRRGLSSACIEGMLASSAPVIAVMDADLQHEETLLPCMLEAVRREGVDVAIGSRYAEGGGTGEWSDGRRSMSRFATLLSRAVLRADLTDPMSGFFMIRRVALMDSVERLSGIGFKVLLDIFASSKRPLGFVELPYEFRTRHGGESKLDTRVAWDFLMMLADKTVGHIVPVRFLSFCFVGGFGVFVHMLCLAVLFKQIGVEFLWAQSMATLCAMTSNFLLNNVLTYRDRRLQGWRLLRGWISFVAVCSLGAVANVGIAEVLFQEQFSWVLSALAGILVGSVWNYAVTAAYTWRVRS